MLKHRPRGGKGDFLNMWVFVSHHGQWIIIFSMTFICRFEDATLHGAEKRREEEEGTTWNPRQSLMGLSR